MQRMEGRHVIAAGGGVTALRALWVTALRALCQAIPSFPGYFRSADLPSFELLLVHAHNESCCLVASTDLAGEEGKRRSKENVKM